MRRSDERGASALELAFLAPALLLLIFFSVQAALYYYGRNVAIQAAREGVAQLRLAQTPDQYDLIIGEVTAKTQKYADTLGGGGLNSADAEPGKAPDYDTDFPRASMTVTGRTISLVPFLPLTVRGRAEGPVETFRGSNLPQ